MKRIGFTTARFVRRRGSGQRGAGIIEFALVALLLFTLAAGAFDYGQAWRTGLTVNEAARTGARVGSAGGTEIESDFYALSGLKASLNSSGQLKNVVRVVIFKATDDNGVVPESCKDGTGASNCQTIEGIAFNTNWEDNMSSAIGATGCLDGIATHTDWCPKSRDNLEEDLDYYGVWVKLRHDFMFPIMGSGTDVERTAVMRLEPKIG